MKNYRDKLLIGFCHAWENLFDFALPNGISGRCAACEKDADEPEGSTGQGFFDLLFFPVIGLGAGLLFLIAARAVNLILGTAATSVLFGIAGAILLESKDHGRGLAAVTAAFRRIFSGSGENRAGELGGALNPTLLTLIVLFKMAALALLYYKGCGAIFPVILVADFSVQAELASCPGTAPDGKSLINASADERTLIRFAGIFLLFFAALPHLGLFLAAALAAAAVALFCERIFLRYGRLDNSGVTFAGSAANSLVLAAALLVVWGF